MIVMVPRATKEGNKEQGYQMPPHVPFADVIPTSGKVSRLIDTLPSHRSIERAAVTRFPEKVIKPRAPEIYTFRGFNLN